MDYYDTNICPNYNYCGGYWQYCEGDKYSVDPRFCSVPCGELTYSCSDQNTCESRGGGIGISME